jgi:hypothetical protein
MDMEFQVKLIERMEELFRWAGAADYDAGMRQFRGILLRLVERSEAIKTREDLARALNELENPSLLQRQLMLGSMRYLPQILRRWLREAVEVAEEEIPAAPTGRPPIDLQARAAVVEYVSQLHKRGCSLELSKKRAGERFTFSESTVQRIWDDRGSIDEADFRSALRWLSEPEQDSSS